MNRYEVVCLTCGHSRRCSQELQILSTIECDGQRLQLITTQDTESLYHAADEVYGHVLTTRTCLLIITGPEPVTVTVPRAGVSFLQQGLMYMSW